MEGEICEKCPFRDEVNLGGKGLPHSCKLWWQRAGTDLICTENGYRRAVVSPLAKNPEGSDNITGMQHPLHARNEAERDTLWLVSFGRDRRAHDPSPGCDETRWGTRDLT